MAKSALRVLQILEFIAEHGDGCSHTQLAQGLGIPKSSATALLGDLQSLGYLVRNAKNRFCIGVGVLSLANAYLRNLNLARLAAPVLSELYSQVRNFSLIGIPVGTDYAVIATESAPALFTHALQIGYRAPLYCSAVGRAILSHLPPNRVDDILVQAPPHRVTAQTETDPAKIKAHLREIRRSGLALCHEENIAGITGVAAAVLDHQGAPVAAIGVAAPTEKLSPVQMRNIQDSVRFAASELSGKLGWRVVRPNGLWGEIVALPDEEPVPRDLQSRNTISEPSS
jgi:DNA-binding IclR family transcriptional regulator